jgi:hypothetical protein
VIVYLGAHLILTGQGFPSECCLHFCHFVKHSTTALSHSSGKPSIRSGKNLPMTMKGTLPAIGKSNL